MSKVPRIIEAGTLTIGAKVMEVTFTSLYDFPIVQNYGGIDMNLDYIPRGLEKTYC